MYVLFSGQIYSPNTWKKPYTDAVFIAQKVRGENRKKYQPSGYRGTRSLPPTPHNLQNPKVTIEGPNWPKGSAKVFTPRCLLTPIKVDNWKRKKEEY